MSRCWLLALSLVCALFSIAALADDDETHPLVITNMAYEVPDVQLVRDDGKRVSLLREMNDGRAVVLNFIFTNCSSFCPLSSQTLGEFQQQLGADVTSVHLMSISIDPEQDTPARLREYARKFGAGPGWQHYTGTLAASRAAQQAFGAYRGDKMSHTPLTLMRAANAKNWRRIDGFVTPEELLTEYHQLLAATPTVSAGEAIYRRGILPSGEPVTAARQTDLRISGAAAACVNCHRRSGLGEVEGRIGIPPISGQYLFHPRAKDRDDLDLPFVETMRPDRDPYTEATLARAIREGVSVDGRPLSYLMPRYSLGDADMSTLIDYLKGMTPTRVPGVGDSVLHFATIITPDADPVKRRGMLDVLEHFFTDKDAFSRAESPRMRSSHRMMFKANRRWLLHVWELSGPPATWDRQLREHLAHEPVLAVISGLGGKTWAPVHAFCEAVALPCLFPNVDLPVVAEQDFYSLYFSKGVLLEAGLIARQLTEDDGAAAPGRVVQVFRPDDIGLPAAKAARAALSDGVWRIVDRPVGAGGTEAALATALKDVGSRDTLVLWLRPGDLAALANIPVRASSVYVSGLMGGTANASLPAPWRRVARLSYPFDLPDQRRIRMDYPLGWFRIRQIPVVDERVQADTYLACGLLAETLSHMADSFIPDYLVERLESLLEHRILTAYYPRLALAPNQRFASKGGYIVRFADPPGGQLIAASDWIVP
jgi:cytochrome oxidase Cu insertion factor (SCO1/SenC/PrrC family)